MASTLSSSSSTNTFWWLGSVNLQDVSASTGETTDTRNLALISQILNTTIFFTCLFIATRFVLARVMNNYKTMSQDNRVDLVSRFVSTVHALVSTYGGIRCILADGGIQGIINASNSSWAFGESTLSQTYLSFTIGYLLFDLALMVSNPSISEPAMILHHVGVVAAYALGLVGHVGVSVMSYMLVNEITTPFLHLRWTLACLNLRDKPIWKHIYLLDALILALLFFTVRILANGYLITQMWQRIWEYRSTLQSHHSHAWLNILVLGVLAVMHLCVNALWMIRIGMAFQRHFTRVSSATVGAVVSAVVERTESRQQLLPNNHAEIKNDKISNASALVDKNSMKSTEKHTTGDIEKEDDGSSSASTTGWSTTEISAEEYDVAGMLEE